MRADVIPKIGWPGVLLILDFVGDSRNFSKSVNSDPSQFLGNYWKPVNFEGLAQQFSSSTHYKPDFPEKKKAELRAKSGLAASFPQHLHYEHHGNAQFTARQLDSAPIQAGVDFQPIHSITSQKRAPACAISDPFRSRRPDLPHADWPRNV